MKESRVFNAQISDLRMLISMISVALETRICCYTRYI